MPFWQLAHCISVFVSRCSSSYLSSSSSYSTVYLSSCFRFYLWMPIYTLLFLVLGPDRIRFPGPCPTAARAVLRSRCSAHRGRSGSAPFRWGLQRLQVAQTVRIVPFRTSRLLDPFRPRTDQSNLYRLAQRSRRPTRGSSYLAWRRPGVLLGLAGCRR